MNKSTTKILKSKENKSTKIALGIAVLLIIIIAMYVMYGTGDKNPIIYGLIILAGYYYYTRKKSTLLTTTDIIKNVADEIHKSGITVNTSLNNVKVSQAGQIGEWHVEFKDLLTTFLYKQGQGIIEQHPGLTVSAIVSEMHENKLAMDRAKMIMREDSLNRKLENLGVLPEEENGIGD